LTTPGLRDYDTSLTKTSIFEIGVKIWAMKQESSSFSSKEGKRFWNTVNVRAATVGDNCIDFYSQTSQVFPDGNAVNVAV